MGKVNKDGLEFVNMQEVLRAAIWADWVCWSRNGMIKLAEIPTKER